MRRGLIIGCLVGLVGLVRASGELPQLPEPNGLSPEARRLIRAKMDRHQSQMSELVWAVILLDYPAVERSAAAIARAPRALEPGTELAALTPYFFEQQDLLRRRASRLARAARDRNGLEMGTAYKLVAETCVDCHVAYLNPPAGK